MEDRDATHLRLRNWARWANDKPLPNLAARISSIYILAGRAASTYLYGYGDDDLDDLPPPIYDQDAELVDAAIRRLSIAHRTAILRQYLHLYRVERLLADAAVRALADKLDEKQVLQFSCVAR